MNAAAAEESSLFDLIESNMNVNEQERLKKSLWDYVKELNKERVDRYCEILRKLNEKVCMVGKRNAQRQNNPPR